MNEQLIQELAVQIDGQIAQSCGSYDPNAKGAYIMQKYPQVRSCASYNDAVLLLAREQAALQAPNGYGQAPNGYGQAPNGYGQAPNGYGQAPNGFGQAPNGYGQAPNGFGQAPNGYAQAPNGFGQAMPNGYEQSAPNGYGQSNGYGQPPTPGVFGTAAVPQSGQPGASQFTAFQPQKTLKGASNDKVFGFIPPNVFAIILISFVSLIVVGGITMSIINVTRPKAPKEPTTQVQQDTGTSTGSAESLFD